MPNSENAARQGGNSASQEPDRGRSRKIGIVICAGLKEPLENMMNVSIDSTKINVGLQRIDEVNNGRNRKPCAGGKISGKGAERDGGAQ